MSKSAIDISYAEEYIASPHFNNNETIIRQNEIKNCILVL